MHSSRTLPRYPRGGGSTPASPWMGSSITAHVFAEMAASISVTFPYSRKRKPSGRGPNPCWYLCCPVAARDPSVRPWKELWKQRISIRSGCPFTTWKWRASLIIASFASVPLLQKKARFSVFVCAVSLSASRTCGSVT